MIFTWGKRAYALKSFPRNTKTKKHSLLASYVKFNTSASSPALMVTISSSFAHFNTFVRLPKLTPKGIGRSHRYFLKPTASSFTDTRATWELSIAWRLTPSSLHSKLASVTSSLIARRCSMTRQNAFIILLRDVITIKKIHSTAVLIFILCEFLCFNIEHVEVESVCEKYIFRNVVADS